MLTIIIMKVTINSGNTQIYYVVLIIGRNTLMEINIFWVVRPHLRLQILCCGGHLRLQCTYPLLRGPLIFKTANSLLRGQFESTNSLLREAFETTNICWGGHLRLQILCWGGLLTLQILCWWGHLRLQIIRWGGHLRLQILCSGGYFRSPTNPLLGGRLILQILCWISSHVVKFYVKSLHLFSTCSSFWNVDNVTMADLNMFKYPGHWFENNTLLYWVVLLHINNPNLI